jgi:pyridoxal 5'-phosphate synthase pdxS subunit
VDAETRAKAIVIATTHFNDAKIVLEASTQAKSAMKGLAVAAIAEADMLQTRGW